MKPIKEGQCYMPGVLESVPTKDGLTADCVLKEGSGIFTMDDRLVGTTDGSLFFAKRQVSLGLDSKTSAVFRSVGNNILINEEGRHVVVDEGRCFRSLKKNILSINKKGS